jgi:hypothetical protein
MMNICCPEESMEEPINLLTLEQFTREEILRDASLSVDDGRYCFKILSDVFGKLVLPRNSDWQTTHALAKKLLTLNSADMKELYTLAVELEEARQIRNHEGVLDRLRSVDIDAYLGARGEIKAGAWAKNGLSSVEFIMPKSKKGKTTDLKGSGEYGVVLVEVKSENQFDLSIGLKSMFKGWVRSRISELVSFDDQVLQVSFGSHWVDAIGAACRINPSMNGASWAFHSVVMSISQDAINRIYSSRNLLGSKDVIRIEPDIQCILTKRTSAQQDPVTIELPNSTKLATLGRIIRDVTNPDYLKQASNQDFVFFFFVQEKPEQIISRTMLGNLFLQSPDLGEHCLGLVIANAVDDELLTISNFRGNLSESQRQERLNKLYSIFNKPKKLERK